MNAKVARISLTLACGEWWHSYCKSKTHFTFYTSRLKTHNSDHAYFQGKNLSSVLSLFSTINNLMVGKCYFNNSNQVRTVDLENLSIPVIIFINCSLVSLVRWCDSELRGPIRIPDKTKQNNQKSLLPGTWTIFTCCKAECVSKYK